MKKLTTILLTILFFSSPLLSYADTVTETVTVDPETSDQESIPVIVENDNSVTSTNKYFELELVRGAQNPLTKSISYTLYVTPRIDSEKTQIKWEVPSTLTAKPSHDEFVNLQKDQTYKYSASIIPQREGSYEVTASVLAWQYNVNYTNSVSSTVTLNESLIVQPLDSSYTVSLLLIVVAGIAVLAGGAFFAYKMSGPLIKRLKVWLTPPY